MPVTPPPSPSAEANLGAALALLKALIRHGLKRLVLCPGSRSAPLAVAAGLLRPHGLDLLTAIDERSAAFLALGLGRADGVPTAVVTTSGSAVANLLPAVVEADHGAVPLLLLTADRPARLKGCGANQTVNQEQFLAASTRLQLQADPAGLASMPAAAIDQLAAAAWSASLADPLGPVHLNLPLEEPLHASAAAIACLQAALPAAGGMAPASGIPNPGPAQMSPAPFTPELLDPDQPGVVVAGPWRRSPAELQPYAAALIRWQRRSGWPVLADPLSGLRGWPGLELIHGYDLLLEDPILLPAPAQVLRLGPMPSSRRLQQWLAGLMVPQLLLSEGDPRNLDAIAKASARLSVGLDRWVQSAGQQLVGAGGPSASSKALAQAWASAERRLQRQLDGCLPVTGPANEPGLSRALSRLLPQGIPLLLANSSPVRDWDSFAAPEAPWRSIFGFRGASGIDGTLSLAAGLARSCGQLVLLSGDLALLHDSNGWLWQRQLRDLGIRLTVVVVENGGGGIFEQLLIRADAAMDFEHLFAMPQSLDHCALAAVHGVPSRSLRQLEALPEALAWALEQPWALLEVRCDRQADAERRQTLRRRMAAASQEV